MLFKKKRVIQESITSDIEVLERPNVKGLSLHEVVELIHKDFNEAGDALVRRTNEILAEAVPSQNELQTLSSLGFNNVPSVKFLEEQRKLVKAKHESCESTKNALRAANGKRVLTVPQLALLCNRWGLIAGNVNSFVGEVPKKNIKEIEAFHRGLSYNNREQGGFVIAATPDLIDTSLLKGMFQVKGSNVFLEKIVKDDPIVLFPVQFEYSIVDRKDIYTPTHFAIVTAWGPEANDPLIKSLILNCFMSVNSNQQRAECLKGYLVQLKSAAKPTTHATNNFHAKVLIREPIKLRRDPWFYLHKKDIQFVPRIKRLKKEVHNEY